ncbi:hypothetical protein Q6A49_14740 [Pseudomonas sp. 22-AL-CL-001]|uniref:hypothetical protein n=1 Tax=Pseudomonas alabamensis TaxID=3064349 RepID=UPI002713EE86|nr:hypothetical protein [Pseudomonas sp. 22-AL-CL-001]MDO7911788.1 hypothetical protein [Pseudomonas sp. 22-AL-CL-001]
MSLKISSTDLSFSSDIEQYQKDDSISPFESIKIRNSADKAIEMVLNDLKTHVNHNLHQENRPDLDWPLRRLQMLSDIVVEDLQAYAKLLRQANVEGNTLTQIQSAIEHQLAYIVLAYNASVGRIKPSKQK